MLTLQRSRSALSALARSARALGGVRNARFNAKPKLAVTLKKDVPGWGMTGDSVEVKRGFARNKLFPEGLAEYTHTIGKAVAAGQRTVRSARRTGAAAEAGSGTAEQRTRRYVEAVRGMLSRATPVIMRKSGISSTGDVPAPPVTAADVLRALGRDFFFLAESDLQFADGKLAIDSWGKHDVKIRVAGSEALAEASRGPVTVSVSVQPFTGAAAVSGAAKSTTAGAVDHMPELAAAISAAKEARAGATAAAPAAAAGGVKGAAKAKAGKPTAAPAAAKKA